MANDISDVTVSITVKDVVNPAAFGGVCLFIPSESDVELPYTEAYSYDEAKTTIEEAELTSGGSAILAMAQIAFMQDPCPEKIGLLSCPINSLSNYLNCEFRYLIPVTSDIEDIKSISAYIESCGAYKVVCVDLTSGSTETGVLKYSDYKTNVAVFKDYERTVLYVGVPIVDGVNSICTALFSKMCSKEVGSYTYKNKVLKSVYADESITRTQLDEYHDNNVNAYVHKAGYDVTSEGKCANGEYIDILDAKDWLITQIKYQLQQILINNDKIPYDDTGIAMLESGVVGVLKTGYNNGMIAESEDGGGAYTVNFARRSETKASDREKRQYMEGRFSFDLAGAVHTVTVNGVINI